ncbi:XVIPCD domain-containing protein [Xanthomonas vasicola]|uniref:XVIPCD domain-containing protein n=1 Tax=Xanthomonas vasicola TaxID=56459 RepID=UPI0001CC0A94|nr:XVIPCD domain-containing protein [Xanthomonas vasicola]KFA26342.1 lipase [Xanthomonas vasicola pv. musacearum NCPPB 4384]AZR29654.1 lipase [Xanthomonas vasicola pv. musacearum NCPPB 4379]KFA04186.1 lipase [Xanthomonas vasicola pv. musacearum NCPPB 4380]KFA05662.1 lipase [Xanthomonas vasicola pv. musacearum NCPPB 2005]KFA18980.1 lipase [Xanthomonas vasicola pv. musacearum NCPPB 4392]
MKPTSQQYAILSNEGYVDHKVGKRGPGDRERVDVGGESYEILEHFNNRKTGYQGTIYQRVGGGDIVVAHRGTEEILRDAVQADGSMVLQRINPQADDAIALTKNALGYAAKQEQRTGHAPEVTVTGHSLGGALAQISAHHFDLKGETFNAYGAASLAYRIPEGGTSVVNHVMAVDPVSAASPHYGEVRVYARPNEIATLSAMGYSNSRVNFLIPDAPVASAVSSLGSHAIKNFLDERSPLNDPQARQLADQNKRMINEYRSDLDEIRAGISLLSRGPKGLGQDAIDAIRGPLAPGEPAKRDAREHSNDHTSLRIDQPGHVGNALFQDAQRGVHAQDARAGRRPDHHSAQLSGSLASEMHAAGGQRIDAVMMSPDAARTFAVQGRVDDPAQLRVSVETMTAMNTPLEQSSQRVAENAARQSVALEQQQSQTQQQGARAMG